MKILKTNTYEELGAAAAEIIISEINSKPSGVFGFATGSTPLSTYGAMVEAYKNGKVDFGKATSFNLDEYQGIEKDDPQSYYSFMWENLFKHVNIQKDKINIPNGMAADITRECSEYEEKIKNAGGIDLQILGIGNNGHIGFNEPGPVFTKATSLVDLTPSTINANARFYNSADEVPKKAFSMGIGTIMHARKIILLISGEAKREILKKAVFGDITPEVPASVLQLHRDVTLVTDITDI